MRACTAVFVLLALPGCKHGSKPTPPPPDPCTILFGTPLDTTGLDATQCQPRCACGGTLFQPPTYDAAFIQALISDWQPAQPYAPLTADPYQQPVPPDDPAGTVCAVMPGDATMKPRPYTLQTFASQAAATAAGGHVTHFGHCGVCSTLANLAVYMREPDLGRFVKGCATAEPVDGGSGDGDLDCLLGLGFDLPCAQIWEYNTNHTRDNCLEICLENFTAPYNLPDGGLNPCLQCDETQSGPVFKAVAGRTRRNSGLPNAICRPCTEVQPLVHSY